MKQNTDDLISREKALEEIEDWERCYTWDEHCRESKEDYIVSPSDVIVNLPSAQQWISCGEKLPEKEGHYLVSNSRNTFEAVFVDGEWYSMSLNLLLDGVLAWMPLPTPWEGGQDD